MHLKGVYTGEHYIFGMVVQHLSPEGLYPSLNIFFLITKKAVLEFSVMCSFTLPP